MTNRPNHCDIAITTVTTSEKTVFSFSALTLTFKIYSKTLWSDLCDRSTVLISSTVLIF